MSARIISLTSLSNNSVDSLTLEESFPSASCAGSQPVPTLAAPLAQDLPLHPLKPAHHAEQVSGLLHSCEHLTSKVVSRLNDMAVFSNFLSPFYLLHQ